MKKVLFATTALVASAGIAAAEGHLGVAISGGAEMGIVGGDRHGETQFFQSVDVRFAMTGETDNGLTFGATIDLDDLADMAIGGSDPVDIGGTSEFADFTVFLSGAFGTLTMGDTDGAFDWALQEVNLAGGSIDDSETWHAGFNGNGQNSYDAQIARYDYSFGDFAFAVSVELDDTGVGDPNFGIGGQYSGDLGGITLGVGLGYQSNGVQDQVGVSLDAAFGGGFSVGVNYSELDSMAIDHTGYGGLDDFDGPDGIPGTADDFANTYGSHWGIGAAYTMDALTFAVNYGVYENDSTCGACANAEGFGLAVNYDLGGGAVAQFGYGQSKVQNTLVAGDTVTTDSFSLGVAMSF